MADAQLLDALRNSGHGLAVDAAKAWDDPVPTCPGWTGADLLRHVGRVHDWAVRTIRAATAGDERRRLGQVAELPEDRDAALDRYRSGLDALVDSLAATDPELEVWTFSRVGADRPHWWARRQAIETVVHAWDAAAAARTEPYRPTAEVAAAGIDEWVTEFLADFPVEAVPGLGGTVHLHATDAPGEGEWFFDLAHRGWPVRREHVPADTAIRGPAADLLAWLWNRDAGPLDVFGDVAVAEGWTRFTV